MGLFDFWKENPSVKDKAEVNKCVITKFSFLEAPNYPWPNDSKFSQLQTLYPQGDFIKLPQEISKQELIEALGELKKLKEEEIAPPEMEKDFVVFYERIWGVIRRGKFEVNVSDYSLKSCCEHAANDIEIEAVYSETAVLYYFSGRREVYKVMPTGVYNTDKKFPKWKVETLFAIKKMFPSKKAYFDKLQYHLGCISSKFLVSPDKTKFICAIEMENVSPASFVDVRSITFRSGLTYGEKRIPHNVCLRPSFYWFSSMIENGYYGKMTETPESHSFELHLGCTTKLVTLNIAPVTAELMERKLVNRLGENWKNGKVQIMAPLSVYQNWGMPFDKDELTEINSCVYFRYAAKHSGAFPRVDLLRYTPEKLREMAEKPFYDRNFPNAENTGGVSRFAPNGSMTPPASGAFSSVASAASGTSEKIDNPVDFFAKYMSEGLVKPQTEAKKAQTPEAQGADERKGYLLMRHLPFIVAEEPDLLDLYK